MKVGYTLQEVEQIKHWFVSKNIDVRWSFSSNVYGDNPDKLVSMFAGYITLLFVKQGEFRDLDKNTITVRDEIAMYFSVHHSGGSNSFHFHKIRYGMQRDYRHKEFYHKEFDKVLVWHDINKGLEYFLENIKIEDVLDNKSYTIINNKVSNYQSLTDRLPS